MLSCFMTKHVKFDTKWSFWGGREGGWVHHYTDATKRIVQDQIFISWHLGRNGND